MHNVAYLSIVEIRLHNDNEEMCNVLTSSYICFSLIYETDEWSLLFFFFFFEWPVENNLFRRILSNFTSNAWTCIKHASKIVKRSFLHPPCKISPLCLLFNRVRLYGFLFLILLIWFWDIIQAKFWIFWFCSQLQAASSRNWLLG